MSLGLRFLSAAARIVRQRPDAGRGARGVC